ncbi:alcohol dehydrogenase catalytic domain-containing protein [Gymnodinialimonas sp. 2305UL16-5]|uniref:zinc-dependent alcohol dehydrogenase n=1 Tax=Gymnodinialimonas mytili TaxID=3126503 RepID=UPI0030AB47C8
MLAVQKISPSRGIELREVLQPDSLGQRDVLVSVEAAGICGTDLHIAAWTPGYEAMAAHLPITLGHEAAGRIERVGSDLEQSLIGRRVAVRPSVVCHTCASCKKERFDLCTKRKGVGVTLDGAFAPFVVVPLENCVFVPSGLSADVAALTEPMTVCKEAVDTASVSPGDKVLVLGPGAIGQGIALFAREAGARSIVVCGYDDESRLNTVKALGFEDVVDTQELGLYRSVKPWLKDGEFDVVIEATGVPEVVNDALDVLKIRGILVVAGIHSSFAKIDLTRLVRRQQQVRGSYRAPIPTWEWVLKYLNDNQDLVKKVITHFVDPADALDGFELAASKTASKVIIRHRTE